MEHGTECGFDAWRKLYNRYVPLADDMQNILIRQLMSIKPVIENDMDGLFDEIERIREQYIKIGSREGPMSEKLVKAAILQNLPEKVVQTLAIELMKAKSVEEIYSIINTYTYDHKTGLPRGQASPMLYLIGEQTDDRSDKPELANLTNGQTTNQTRADDKDQTSTRSQADGRAKDGQELYAASKGKGKGKTCWLCGEAGRFQRECPKAKDANIIAALKGEGKGKGKKGKFGKGNYKGGYGKGKNNNWYRAPGKAIGKGGIHYSGGDDDYWSAWGCDGDEWSGYYNEDYSNYYIGNVAMLLERKIENETTETTTTTTQPNTTTQLNTTIGSKHNHKQDLGANTWNFDRPSPAKTLQDVDMLKFVARQRDALRGTASAAPVTLSNSFNALRASGDDSDDDEEDTGDENEKDKAVEVQRKPKTARRRRWTSKSELKNGGCRRVAFHSSDSDDYTTEGCCKADNHGSDAASRTVDNVKKAMSRASVRFATPLACSIPETCSSYDNGDTIHDAQQCTHNYNNQYSTTYSTRVNDPTNDHVGARHTLSARAQTPALSVSLGWITTLGAISCSASLEQQPIAVGTQQPRWGSDYRAPRD